MVYIVMAFQVVSSTLLLYNSLLQSNRAVFYGGAIWASAGSTVKLDNAVLQQNSAASNEGGAVYLDASRLVASMSNFKGNTAPSGGAIGVLSSRDRKSNV